MKLQTLAALALALAAPFAIAQTTEAAAKNLTKASAEAVGAYKKGGVSGLIDAVQTCWSKADPAPYCLYLDLSAKRVNDVKSAEIGAPSHEFFTPAATAGRAYEAMSAAPMTNEQKHAYVNTVATAANQATDKRLAAR